MFADDHRNFKRALEGVSKEWGARRVETLLLPLLMATLSRACWVLDLHMATMSYPSWEAFYSVYDDKELSTRCRNSKGFFHFEYASKNYRLNAEQFIIAWKNHHSNTGAYVAWTQTRHEHETWKNKKRTRGFGLLSVYSLFVSRSIGRSTDACSSFSWSTGRLIEAWIWMYVEPGCLALPSCITNICIVFTKSILKFDLMIRVRNWREISEKKGKTFGDVLDLTDGGVGEEPFGDLLLLLLSHHHTAVRH